ncbi:hypothetical protein evm_008580 [Chilo suppressalis]|nr:hypothetical protein evm_008580 [Chilo suppressalis]
MLSDWPIEGPVQICRDGTQSSNKMALPHITTFCCCLGLEQGAKVIGYLHLLTSLTMMVVCSLFADRVGALVGTVEDAEDGLYSTWYTIAVVVAVVSVAHIFLAITLLVSIYKRASGGVRAYVWVMGALYACALLYLLWGAVRWGMRASGSEIFLSFLEGLLFFGEYTTFIIHHHHKPLNVPTAGAQA